MNQKYPFYAETSEQILLNVLVALSKSGSKSNDCKEMGNIC